MSGANRFGSVFQVTTFGESHGTALGCVVDGCPAGIPISEERLKLWLERRRPGQSPWVSARHEPDEAEILSGIFAGKTLGTPIAATVRNQDARSSEYTVIEEAVKQGLNPRAGHADDLWRKKHGYSDVRGGGRASGRETVARVIAGAIAEAYSLFAVDLLNRKHEGLQVIGYARQIGPFSLSDAERASILQSASQDANGVRVWPADAFSARFPSTENHAGVAAFLTEAVRDGESFGGVAELVIRGLPAGLGEPVFHKFKSDLAFAMMSVGATTSFELGDGVASVSARGTEFHSQAQGEGGNSTARTPYGGIRGGLTTGEDIQIRVGFKPTSTVMDLAKRGRHDPCIVPRAIPVLEAMAWLVIADHLRMATGPT